MSHYCLLLFLPDFNRMRRENVSDDTIDELFGMDLKVDVDFSLKIGFCTLSSCEASHIKTITRGAIDNYYLELDEKCNCGKRTTFSDRLKSADLVLIIALFCLVSLLGLVLTAGFFETRNEEEKQEGQSLSIADKCHQIFSPKKSYEDLIYAEDDDRWIGLKNGRALITPMVCGMHFFAIDRTFRVNLVESQFEGPRSGLPLWIQPLSSGGYWKLLMVLGGTTTGISLARIKKLTLKQMGSLIVKRFFKSQPLILATTCLELISPLMGSGPAFYLFSTNKVDEILRSLLANILHLSNIHPLLTNQMNHSLPHFWTISCEFQIYILVILLLYFQRRTNSKWIFPAAIIVALIFNILYVTLVDIHPIPYVYPFKIRNLFDYLRFYYYTPIPNTWPFLMSFWLILIKIEGRLDNFSGGKKLLKICSLAAFLASFAPSYFSTFENKPTPLSKFVYMTFTEAANALFFGSLMIFSYDPRVRAQEGNPKDLIGKKFNKDAGEKSLDYKNFFRKVFKSCFFVHVAVLIWVYSTTRQTLQITSINFLLLAVKGLGVLFMVAILYHFLVLSPHSRAYQRFAKAKPKLT